VAIVPTAINPQTRTVAVRHEETGHTGAIPFANVGFARNQDGTKDYRYATLHCPVAGCDTVSVYPVAGGSLPDSAQALFVAAALAASPADLPNPPTTLAEARARVQGLVEAMDGVGRWRGGGG